MIYVYGLIWFYMFDCYIKGIEKECEKELVGII